MEPDRRKEGEREGEVGREERREGGERGRQGGLGPKESLSPTPCGSSTVHAALNPKALQPGGWASPF